MGSPTVQTAARFPAWPQPWDSRDSPARSAGLSLLTANDGAPATGSDSPAGEGQRRAGVPCPEQPGKQSPLLGWV